MPLVLINLVTKNLPAAFSCHVGSCAVIYYKILVQFHILLHFTPFSSVVSSFSNNSQVKVLRAASIFSSKHLHCYGRNVFTKSIVKYSIALKIPRIYHPLLKCHLNWWKTSEVISVPEKNK